MIYLLLNLLSATENGNFHFDILTNRNLDPIDFVNECSSMDFDGLNPTIQIMNTFSNLHYEPIQNPDESFFSSEDISFEIMNLDDTTISVVSEHLDACDLDGDNDFSGILDLENQNINETESGFIDEHFEDEKNEILQFQAGDVNSYVDYQFNYNDLTYDSNANELIYNNLNLPENPNFITFRSEIDLFKRTDSDFKSDFRYLFSTYQTFYRRVVSRNFAATSLKIRNLLKIINYKSIQNIQECMSAICLINTEIQTKKLKLTFFRIIEDRPTIHQNFFIDALYEYIDISSYGADNLLSLSHSFICLLKNLESALFYFQRNKTCYLKLFIFEKINNLNSSVCKYMLLQYFLMVESYHSRKRDVFELMKCLALSKYLANNLEENMNSRQFCDFILILIPPHSFSKPLNLKSKMGNILDCLYQIRIRESPTINIRDVYKYFGMLLLIKEYKPTSPVFSEEDLKDFPELFIKYMGDFVCLTMNDQIIN